MTFSPMRRTENSMISTVKTGERLSRAAVFLHRDHVGIKAQVDAQVDHRPADSISAVLILVGVRLAEWTLGILVSSRKCLVELKAREPDAGGAVGGQNGMKSVGPRRFRLAHPGWPQPGATYGSHRRWVNPSEALLGAVGIIGISGYDIACFVERR